MRIKGENHEALKTGEGNALSSYNQQDDTIYAIVEVYTP